LTGLRLGEGAVGASVSVSSACLFFGRLAFVLILPAMKISYATGAGEAMGVTGSSSVHVADGNNGTVFTVDASDWSTTTVIFACVASAMATGDDIPFGLIKKISYLFEGAPCSAYN
jgi:hypothetical protein